MVYVKLLLLNKSLFLFSLYRIIALIIKFRYLNVKIFLRSMIDDIGIRQNINIRKRHKRCHMEEMYLFKS